MVFIGVVGSGTGAPNCNGTVTIGEGGRGKIEAILE